LNFEDERYVRVYTRKTVTTKLLGWDGRMCLHALLLEVDRAGVLDLEGLDPAEALAALADLPLQHARTGMAKLLERKVVVVTDGVLFVPNFIRAQEAKQSDAQRQRESRARRAAALRAAEMPGVPAELVAVAVTVLETSSQPVTIRDAESLPVTERHDRSQPVTVGHSSSAVPSRTKPAVPEIARPREEAPPPAAPVEVADQPFVGETPRNPAEAMRMPIAARAAYTERNRHMAEWLTPETWPEVQAVAQAVHEANGMRGTARLLPYAKDSGVRAVVALLAAGFEPDELLTAVRGVTKSPWWRADGGKPRSLGALSVEVIRREQAGARETQLSPHQLERIARAKSGLKPDPNRSGGPKSGPALLGAVLPTLAAVGES
jgi:hypothetical protein